MAELVGRQLGPYEIVSAVGAGNMASVYKARRAGASRYVALKVLPRHLAADPVAVERFEQEARFIADLQHPNILPLHDFGRAGDYTYIAMPLVEHGTLKSLLRGNPVSQDEIYRVISQVGDALHHMHAIGVIHRDVKPSNVLLDQYGNCMLTDFGIAKLASGAAQFTGTGVSVGTPTYMSPEQALAGAMDHRSDIYSLGVILYQMATGRVPFTGKTAIATALMHINDPLPSPREANPALAPEVERVIERSLAKRPEDRYATASGMVSDLQEAMLGRG